MRVLALVLAGLLVCSIAQAGVLDDAVAYVKARPAKIGVSYNLDDKDMIATAGTALVENAFGVDNLDIDLLVSGEGTNMFDSDNKIVTLGPSYNIQVSENSKISLGISAGVERFENFDDGNLGEAKALVSVMYKHKF